MKKKEVIKWQRLREKDCKPVGENSLYWEWVKSISINGDTPSELPVANPDMLEEQDEYRNVELEEIIEELFQVLSPMEKQVATLGMEGKDDIEIAVKLSIPRRTVGVYLKRMENKLQKLYAKMPDSCLYNRRHDE